MGFFSFLGRVLFASIFILSAWQMFNEFGHDGGPAAKEWAPKLALLHKHINGTIAKDKIHIDAKSFVAASIVMKGLGGLLFVIGSSLGAHILILHIVLTAPLMHDFYNYKPGKPEFFRVLYDFLLYAALVGALLFFLAMKSSISRKQPKKKMTKAKAA